MGSMFQDVRGVKSWTRPFASNAFLRLSLWVKLTCFKRAALAECVHLGVG